MKRTAIFAVLIILLLSPAFSQTSDSTKSKKNDEFKTLFGNNRPGGAYGAFSAGYTEIDNVQAVSFGGKFEWIVGHSIGFGFGGNGFINEYHWDENLERDVFLTGGYGGFIIEPILFPKFPVHLSFPVLLGAGGISYITKENQDYQNMIEDSEVFLIAEPMGELEFNITRHFRLALGASYRFATPFNVGASGTSPVSSDAIQSWTYMMTFKFGRF
jgi:opacity protein-like surface antigen